MYLVTAFERGGMNRKLCTADKMECWSLHALWDAEILKLISNENDAFDLWKEEKISFEISGEKFFELENWCIELNYYICKLYEYPNNFTIENYVQKYKYYSLYFVKKAVENISNIINLKAIPRQFENDFVDQCP